VVVNPVCEIQGIITERDLIHYAATGSPIFSAQVGSLMSTNVIVRVLQDEIDSVVHTMTEKRFRHLPVLDD